MTSVADALRADTRRRMAALSADERLRLALALGDDDAAAFAASHGVSLDEARRVLSRSRRQGRRPSACMDGRRDAAR